MRYALQRLGQFLIVFVLVTFGVMVLLRLGFNDTAGRPKGERLARALLGGTQSQTLVDATIAKYHLGSNYFVQYAYWLKNMVRLDFGYSVPNNLPVTSLMKTRVLTTAFIGVYALILALIIAIPLAVYQASKRDGAFDRVSSGTSFLFVSIPTIVLAVFLKLLFVDRLGWFPRIGNKIYPWDSLSGHFKNFFLPVLSLSLPSAAIFTRLLRSDMVLTLQSDFIGLARAKGMSARRILWGHALRNSLFSLLTSVGVQLGALIGGAIVAETFFDLDGLGTMLIVAVLSSDLFTVQSTAALLVVTVVLVNLVVDLGYSLIDPRVRHARALA